MTIRSTENSIQFYRDVLGMTVAGGTLNMGTEQQHLDSLPGARARVTGMKPVMGQTGLEFLEYQLPAAGRPFPADSHPTDLWHWQTTLVVSDAEAVAARVRGMATVRFFQYRDLAGQGSRILKGISAPRPGWACHAGC